MPEYTYYDEASEITDEQWEAINRRVDMKELTGRAYALRPGQYTATVIFPADINASSQFEMIRKMDRRSAILRGSMVSIEDALKEWGDEMTISAFVTMRDRGARATRAEIVQGYYEIDLEWDDDGDVR